jgi:hypothetical protein
VGHSFRDLLCGIGVARIQRKSRAGTLIPDVERSSGISMFLGLWPSVLEGPPRLPTVRSRPEKSKNSWVTKWMTSPSR